MIKALKLSALSCVLTLAAALSANAAVVNYLWEQSGNIEAQASGTLDLTGVSFFLSFSVSDDFRLQPSGGSAPEVLFYGDGDIYIVTATMPAFGSGTDTTIEPGQSEGDHFGWEGQSSSTSLLVPTGFVSGGSIFSTGRILGESFASLGITPGTYALALPNDTITLKVGTMPPAVIPLPAGLPLLIGALGAVALLRRRA